MITIENFRHVGDPARARALFRRSVDSVEIEIFSYCNRVCSFCPNSIVDRRGKNVLMDPALYSKIIDDLAEVEYAGIIWYSRYNEPTADRVFLDRLREARRKLPNARLQTYSNGDYLDADYIDDLRDAGLDELKIMAYLPNDAAHTQPAFLNLMVQRLDRLGLPWKFVTTHNARVDAPGIDVTYNYEFFLTAGTNRAGALPTGGTIGRQSPCIIPSTSIFIDHNGAMVPCCDIRSDVAAHRDHVVYTMTPTGSLFEAYANSKLVEWRRGLCGFGPKQAPCDTCNRDQWSRTPEMEALFASVEAMARSAIAEEAADVAPVADEGFRVIVPTRDSAGWIAALVAAYDGIGLRPLFVVDSRSADDTAATLRRLGTDMVEVTPSEDRVEDIVWRIPSLTRTRWILRLDDDELPSRGLLAWVGEFLHSFELPKAAFPRRWAMGDGAGRLAYSQRLEFFGNPHRMLDPQVRLFRSDQVRYDRALHNPGFSRDGQVYVAPPEAYICHFDWIVRDADQRRAKLERYAAQAPQPHAALLEQLYLPETSEAWQLRATPFDTDEFDALAFAMSRMSRSQFGVREAVAAE